MPSISKIHLELQKAITLTELALSFLLNVFNLWISTCLQSCMQFHHCLFKILRKNQNVAGGWMNRWKDGQCENSISPQTQFAGGIINCLIFEVDLPLIAYYKVFNSGLVSISFHTVKAKLHVNMSLTKRQKKAKTTSIISSRADFLFSPTFGFLVSLDDDEEDDDDDESSLFFAGTLKGFSRASDLKKQICASNC